MAIVSNSTDDFRFPEPFEFEKLINMDKCVQFLKDYRHISLYVSAVYISSIFSLKSFMKSRPAYSLKPYLATWNLMLAVFSILCSIRLLPVQLTVLNNFGYAASLCDSVFFKSQPVAFWGALYVFSKVLELGDTVFLVLRKRRLIFLHWYHHTVTMLMVFHLADNAIALSLWFTILNLIVHSFMYTYYFLMSIGIKLPRWVSVTLTSVQILQMVMGMLICMACFALFVSGVKCGFPVNLAHISLVLYGIYFYLFSRLFYQSYISDSKKTN